MVMRPIYEKEELKQLEPTGKVRYCIIVLDKDYGSMMYEKRTLETFSNKRERDCKYISMLNEHKREYARLCTEDYVIVEE